MVDDPIRFALGFVGSSDAQVEEWDAHLRKDPEDAECRLKLLGACFGPPADESRRRRRADHIVWFVEHDPTHAILASPVGKMFSREEGFDRIAEAWADHLQTSRPDPHVVLHAAHFFTTADPARSTELLELGERIEPTWPNWGEELGTLAMRSVDVTIDVAAIGRKGLIPMDQIVPTAASALAHFERALAVAGDQRGWRFSLLASCARAAVIAQRFPEAKRYADAVLALAPACEDEFHAPDYVHDAHISRGHVALASADLPTAREELAAAGAIGSPNAPVLRSFGPDFRLAAQLLERGEKDAVVAYLDRCATFWNPKRIARWKAELAAGERPKVHRGFEPGEE